MKVCVTMDKKEIDFNRGNSVILGEGIGPVMQK